MSSEIVDFTFNLVTNKMSPLAVVHNGNQICYPLNKKVHRQLTIIKKKLYFTAIDKQFPQFI